MAAHDGERRAGHEPSNYQGDAWIARGQCERGLTVVWVTHDPTIAAHARHVIRMPDGMIVG